MRPREWLIPAAVGLATGLILLWMSPLEPSAESPRDEVRVPPFTAPFAAVAATQDASPVLVVWDRGPLPGPFPGPPVEVEGWGVQGHAVAQRILFLDPASLPDDPEAPLRRVPADPEAPRVPADGNATLNITVYVFDAQGRLVASNDAADAQARFAPYGDLQIPPGPLHLGPGPAPEGTLQLPVLRDEARVLVAGMRVGGVVSAAVENHPYMLATGPLYVTARLDGIVATGDLS